MGLGISSYSRIKHDTNGEIFVGIDEFGTHQDLPEGRYSPSKEYRHHSFRAGSYSGYNRWRETLSLAIHGVMPSIIWDSPGEYKGKDFFEIINFSDCEGFMGPQVSKKLHSDFIKNREIFIQYLHSVHEKMEGSYSFNYDLRVYDDFTLSFEISKDSGVLIFC